MQEKHLRIIFMGTPEFAVASLKALLEAGNNIVAVVTAPDKPSGRSRQIQRSPVKQFAISHGIEVMQPASLRDPTFIQDLTYLKPDLNVLVAFRMLPKEVWSVPVHGTVNLHASLLPEYRGAAPINHAIMNGEKETGVTTFQIDRNIDTGNILLQEKVAIGDNETAGELHDRLMITGAELLVKTVDEIAAGKIKPTAQNMLTGLKVLKSAPKIYREDCRINWNQDVDNIFNFIRGLSPYPAAWTIFKSSDDILELKIFKADKVKFRHNIVPGTIETDGKSVLKIAAAEGYIDILSLQLAGKRQLSVEEFLRGFGEIEKYRAL